MTTPAQGKGKKKNKEVTKLSLDEFNQTNAAEGYSVINLNKTGIDWAEAMADYDRSSIVVPVVPRSQRGPDVDYDSLPDEPPFRAQLYNIPMSVDEKELRDRFFHGLEVKHVDITKLVTTVEFISKEDLYEALCKNGTNLKNRTIEVVPYGARPDDNRGDRYGGGRGGSSYGGNRSEGGFGRMGDRGGFNDRDRGFNDRDRGFNDRDRGFNDRGGYNPRGGHNDRGSFNDRGFNRGDRGDREDQGGQNRRSETADNWRARPAAAVTKPQPTQPMQQQQHYQQKPYHNQPRYNQNYNPPPPQSNQHHYPPQHSYQNNRPGPMNNNRPMNSWSGSGGHGPPSGGSNPDLEERPKLIIKKRETPLDIDDVSTVKRNEAIFGQAKPSSKPYEKMKEVEEKLKS